VFRKAAEAQLGEDLLAVDCHLESTAVGLDQLDIDPGKLLLQLGLQTEGLWRVVSGYAVFYSDVHRNSFRFALP
jgi:hypothetical protein